MHCVTCPAKHVMTSTERKEGMRKSDRDASGSMSIDRSERGGERMRGGESLHRIHKKASLKFTTGCLYWFWRVSPPLHLFGKKNLAQLHMIMRDVCNGILEVQPNIGAHSNNVFGNA